jgi:hypothetical protein
VKSYFHVFSHKYNKSFDILSLYIPLTGEMEKFEKFPRDITHFEIFVFFSFKRNSKMIKKMRAKLSKTKSVTSSLDDLSWRGGVAGDA